MSASTNPTLFVRCRSCIAVISLWSVLAATVAYRFAYQFPDELEYWTLAQNLIHRGIFSLDGVTPSAYRPPLLAWVLSPFAAFDVSISTARVCLVLFFAASGVMASVFLCRIFPVNRLLAAMAAAFVLCHPLYFFSAGNLYPQAILTPLFLLALYCASVGGTSKRSTLIRAGVIGLCTGASILANPASIFSLLPIWVVVALHEWKAIYRRQSTSATGLIVAGLITLALILPWTYRNCRTVHPGIYISLNSGINLLFGNSPLTTPGSGVDVDLSDYQQQLSGENEFEPNRRLTQSALENVQSHPAYYANLYVRKFLFGFGNTVSTVTHGPNRFGTWLMQIYMALVWIGVFLLIFAGRKANAHRHALPVNWELLRCLTILVLAAYFLNLAGYSVFFNRLRFRIPMDVALALISAAGWTIVANSTMRSLGVRTHPCDSSR